MLYDQTCKSDDALKERCSGVECISVLTILAKTSMALKKIWTMLEPWKSMILSHGQHIDDRTYSTKISYFGWDLKKFSHLVIDQVV